MRLVIRAAFLSAAMMIAATAARAKPEYARKERKACVYCHVRPLGGGPRNPRGVYYEMHNRSFEGYDEAKVMGTRPGRKAGEPSYRSAWKVELSAGTRRIAVADLFGDKRPRLLALREGSKLAVIGGISESASKLETELDLGNNADRFVAGSFAHGRPAVIVAPRVVYFIDGGKFVMKAIPDLADITGFVRFKDGREGFFVYRSAGGAPESWEIDLNAENVLKRGRDMPTLEQGASAYNEITARFTAETAEEMNLPQEIQRAGVLGLIDPRGDGKWFVWVPVQSEDGSYLMLTTMDSIGSDAAGDIKPVWKSPKLSGKLIDAVPGRNARNPKEQGLYVLQATGAEQNGRLLEFFVVE